MDVCEWLVVFRICIESYSMILSLYINIDVTLFMRIVTQGKRTYSPNPVSRNRVSKIIPKIYGLSLQVTRLVNGARGD